MDFGSLMVSRQVVIFIYLFIYLFIYSYIFIRLSIYLLILIQLSWLDLRRGY